MRLPNFGEMAIFDRSWYGRVLVERVEKLTPPAEWRKAYRDIVEFERMLADDGVVIIKFWMHISKQEQKKRFKKIEKNPLESWRVTDEDWRSHKKYGDYLLAAEEMFERTDSEYGPWTVVEATSRWYARRKVFDTIIGRLEQRLGGAAPKLSRLAKTDRQDADLRAAMDRMDKHAEQEEE
jgi:polyphosphate kinase 2 (PPK2 family)